MAMPITIQCHCGDVKIELTGDPLACVYCHCDDCQTVHGAAYLPAAMYWARQTRIVTGEPLRWKLKRTTRATCRQCGTRLFAEPADMSIRTITAYLLPAGIFRPTFHIQCQHALLPVADDLPHFKGFPAIFGGSDECVSW
jgi:hypothetical protein